MIVQRVRGDGNGVRSPGGNTSKLAPLSPKYIAARAKDAALHPDTSPATSNLTRHGDMLDALQVRVTGDRVSVFVPPGKQLDKAMYTNAARPWINISKGEATRLRELLARLVKQKL